ncbi:MAG: glycosyltransferase 87 family protein [Methanocella sp.]
MAKLSDRMFFWAAVAVLGAIVAVLTFASLYFLQHVYMLGDISYFYSMVDVILKGGTPYVDYKDSKPPLIYLIFSIPALLGQRITGIELLVGLCNLASAVLVLQIGWKIYGRAAGLLAAVFFAVNLIWAEGYFPLIEPFVVVFMLLAVRELLSDGRHRYLYAGICAGIAIGFKQYALLFLLISLFFLYRRKELKGAPTFLAGAVVPLIVIFGSVFLIYGQAAGWSCLYMSFGFAESYVTQSFTGEVTGYNLSGPLMLLVNVVLGTSLFVMPLLCALLAFARCRRSLAVEYFALLGIAFAATVVVRPFFHYWALAMPFVALACASVVADTARKADGYRPFVLQRGLIPGSVSLNGLILALFSIASLKVMQGFLDNLGQFRGWAEIFVGAVYRYLDWGRGAPLQVYVVSNDAIVGLAIVCILCFACALLVLWLGARAFGNAAGAIAGLFFTLSIAWAIGSVPISTVAALLLVLLSVVFLVGQGNSRKLAAGLLAGMSAVFVPFALLAAPASLYWLWKKGDSRGSRIYVIGALLPVALFIISMALQFVPAPHGLAGLAGGVVVTFTQDRNAAGNSYGDPFLAAANIIASLSALTSLYLLAVAGFCCRRPAGATGGLLLAGSLLFIVMLLTGQYLHCWIFALPFAALLCAGLFSEDQKVIIPIAS